MRPGSRQLSALALLAAAATALAGCSSSGSSSSASASASSGSAGSSAPSSATAAAAADKSPIKVLQIAVLSNPGFSDPQAADAAKAWVKQANAAGGINGHPIQLEVCDSNLDPNKETACLQQAVTDKVAAVVGSLLVYATGVKLIEKAGIPLVGGNSTTEAELTSKVSFPASGGEASWFYGEAALMKIAGAKKPTMLYCDTPSCALDPQYANAYWKSAGQPGEISKIEAPLATAQYSAQATAATSGGADGVMVATSTDPFPKVVTALRQASFKGPIAAIDSNITGATVKAMGADADGLLVSGLLAPLTDSGNPGVKAFSAAMEGQNPSASKDGISETAWNSFDLFGQVAKTVTGDVTAASLTTALQNVKQPITLGLSGPWISPDQQGTPANSEFPRLTKDTFSFIPEKVTGGQLVATGARQTLAAG